MRLYLDIETLPDLTTDAGTLREQARAMVPGSYKKPESIDRWIDENWLEIWQRTALDPMRGVVLCVGIAVQDGPAKVLWNEGAKQLATGNGLWPPPLLANESGEQEAFTAMAQLAMDGEKELLELLSNGLQRYPDHTIVAHNGIRFDFPWLRWRGLKHGVYSLCKRLHQAKPWDEGLSDTLAAICAPERARKGATLDGIAHLLGIARANPIDGSQVWGRYLAGDLESIAQHCKDDIEVLRELDYYLLLAGLIK